MHLKHRRVRFIGIQASLLLCTVQVIMITHVWSFFHGSSRALFLKSRAVNPTRTMFSFQTRSALMKMISTGTTAFDKKLFQKKIEVLALKVNKRETEQYIKKLNPYLLSMPTKRRVLNYPASPKTSNLILFSPHVTCLESLPQASRDFLERMEYEFSSHLLSLGYNDLSVQEVLQELLPEGVQVPSSFEAAGHICHLNLREQQLPFKEIIGQVILDKHPKTLRTVVNKVGKITSQFRTFEMEVIAGDSDMIVEVKEQDARLRFDFSKVYWNSRLQAEHARLVSLFQPEDLICDMFCGVGPFAVPAAMKGCNVLANDLNPNSYHYLQENIRQNKVSKRVLTYNMDARDFIRTIVFDQNVDHIIMNLPDSSIQFLDVFKEIKYSSQTQIHCYCFSSSIDPESDAINRIEDVLDLKLKRKDVKTHQVRGVSPTKVMLCISFCPFS
mmetsp:Transcript_38788/g.51110  ORF Transcript_38788/g.51110 Transcript_38788/m.51110 type:complete len:442 (-) Transcript_38788:244-1569(-)